jgi:Rrf2 family protein
LAEHAGEGSFSANDLAEFYGLPHEALAKILQRLATAGVLTSHHGIKGGYTFARDPRHISVFDVIKASEETGRSSLHSEPRQRLGTGNGYDPLRMVSQVVEDTLHELTIEDIEEKSLQPRRPLARCFIGAKSQLEDQTTRSP